MLAWILYDLVSFSWMNILPSSYIDSRNKVWATLYGFVGGFNLHANPSISVDDLHFSKLPIFWIWLK